MPHVHKTILILTCLLCLPALPAHAQLDGQTPPTAPTATADAPNAPTPNNADADGEAKPLSNELLLNFQDAPLQEVLTYLSEQAGLIIVNDSNVKARVTVMNRQPITIDEAVDLINTILMEEGYTAVRRGRLLRLVRLEDAKLDSIPVRYGNNPDVIGDSDTIITQIIPIRYAEAEALSNDLKPLVDDSFAQLTANASSNSLIMTDTEANVHRIVQIVNAVDKSISSVTQVRVFPLSYADAEDTAQLLEETFQEHESADSAVSRAVQRRFSRFGPPGFGGNNNDQQTQVQGRTVSASSDERTNSVVVSASPELMDVVADVITQLDADTTARESVLVYHVKHILATDLETAFNALFDENNSSSSNNGNTPRNFQGRGGQNNNGSSSDTTAGSLVGQVTTVANEATNTLMVLTPERNHDRVMAILDALDTEQPQVLIRVLIAEVTLDDSLDAGVEGGSVNSTGSLDSLLTDFSVAAASGGLKGVVLDSNISVNIRLLQELGKLEIISRPYIIASDNQASNITIGEEFPFVTNTRETDAGNTINTIEYREIGLILNVTPQINPDNRVTLDVSQELSAISGKTVPISEQLDAQVIAKRLAETRVAIQDGQTVVIGGLMEDQATLTEKKVPLLGDLPLVGNLFRRTQSDKTKTELLLFLTPEIVRDVGQLEKIGDAIHQSAENIDNAVAPGTLQRHLWNMKTHYDQTQNESQPDTNTEPESEPDKK